MAKTYYALQSKKYALEFQCASANHSKFQDNVNKAYWSWRGCQTKGMDSTKDEYLALFNVVKITVEDATMQSQDLSHNDHK